MGGICMKYNNEFKRKCVVMYREGKYSYTLEGMSKKELHDVIRQWVRTEEAVGQDVLKHKKQNKLVSTANTI